MQKQSSIPTIDSATTLLGLRALGHASRLSAYRALIQAGADGLAVGALRELLALPPATLSAHLNVLRAAGLVNDAREGRVIRVRADYARMNALIGFLTENCCDSAPCMPAVVCASSPDQRKTAQRKPAHRSKTGRSKQAA